MPSVEMLGAQDEKTFRSKYSQLSQSQLVEMENWGKSVDGYTGGGNFDDNPKLENFTLKKYNQMKEQGALTKITKLEESKAYTALIQNSNSQSQMLLMDENRQFQMDDLQVKSELAMVDTKRTKALKRRQLYNNSSNYNYKVSKSQHQSIISVGQNSVHDSVEYKMEYDNANELLHLKPDDILYPKKKLNPKRVHATE